MKTKLCIKCLKSPAVLWVGHVRKGRQRITAGWCRSCLKLVRKGYEGQYVPRMGAEGDDA